MSILPEILKLVSRSNDTKYYCPICSSPLWLEAYYGDIKCLKPAHNFIIINSSGRASPDYKHCKFKYIKNDEEYGVFYYPGSKCMTLHFNSLSKNKHKHLQISEVIDFDYKNIDLVIDQLETYMLFK